MIERLASVRTWLLTGILVALALPAYRRARRLLAEPQSGPEPEPGSTQLAAEPDCRPASGAQTATEARLSPEPDSLALVDAPDRQSPLDEDGRVRPRSQASWTLARYHQTWLFAEGLILAVLIAVALAPRLSDLEGPRSSFPDLFDEGIRSEQLLLMANGFRPFRDIYTAQGLLLLDVLYPFYALFGGTLGAIRLGVGLLSVVGIVGVWWSARSIVGGLGGLAAAFLLTASPAYLEGSRLALAEVPSLVPCIWAVGCGVRWQRGGPARWLYAAVVLATIGVLVKPMVLAVAAPLALLALLRPGLRPRHVLIATALGAGIAALAILWMGPSDVYQQIVQYRLGARQGATWDFRRNLKQVVWEPSRDQPGLFILAAAAGLLLTFGGWRTGLALSLWPVAAIGLLLVYYPLHPKHLVYIYPPLALLGGAGLGRAASLAWQDGPSGRSARLLTVGLALVLAAIPVSALPGTFEDPSRDDQADDTDLHVFDQDAALSLKLLSGPREFVLTDHPYVTALAHRLVPPNLVDPSRGRTRAGVLTDAEAISAAEQYDTRLILIWADRLRRLAGVPPWLQENFVLSDVFGSRSVKNPRGAKDRAIYLRKDTDFDAARAQLESALQVREPVEFEGKLRLLGASLSTNDLGPKEQLTVTLGWLALSPMTSDYHITVQLVGPGDDLRSEQEHDLEGSVRGTSTWDPGRWLFRTFAVQPDDNSPAGDYELRVSVLDPKTGKALRPTLQPGSSSFWSVGQRAVALATVHLH